MDDNSSYNVTSVWKDFSKAPDGKNINNKLIHIRTLGEFYAIYDNICVLIVLTWYGYKLFYITQTLMKKAHLLMICTKKCRLKALLLLLFYLLSTTTTTTTISSSVIVCQ